MAPIQTHNDGHCAMLGTVMGLFILLLTALWLETELCAQTPATPDALANATNSAEITNLSTGTPAERLAGLHLEMTNAYNRVLAIVNQFVPAYREAPGMRVSRYSPGWFHEGAAKPNFNTVDVRQTQDLNYRKHDYVTSDLNPGFVFRGQDLEFNSMTKYFYTNRSLPKHRLSEA